MMLLFSPCNGAPVPVLMRFSAPVKKHWLGSFSIVLPPSGLHGFAPVVLDRWEQGRAGCRVPGTGRGGDTMKGRGGGVWGPDPSIYIYIYANPPPPPHELPRGAAIPSPILLRVGFWCMIQF